MPPTKDNNQKQNFSRSFSNNGLTMSARVYHPATNLTPPSPPVTPTGAQSPFSPRGDPWGRQNSQNGKYS